MKASDLEWGLKDESIEAPALWGARCILECWTNARGERMHALDVLWDRQDLAGEEPEVLRLKAALNDRYAGGASALQGLREAVVKGELWFPQTDEVKTWIVGKERMGDAPGWMVQFHCSTRASYGYLYVTARLVTP